MPFRILIADDNPSVRTALRQLLSGKDREIFEALDGADALAKALDTRPDVAVLDLAMPSMDGLSVARELLKQLPNTAVVMCTMHWSPQLKVEALKFGISHVISKAQGGVLVSTVEEILASRQTADAEAQPTSLMVPPEMLGSGPTVAASGTAEQKSTLAVSGLPNETSTSEPK